MLLPKLYVVSIDSGVDISEVEGYVCEHSFDEEAQAYYCYASSNSFEGREVVLTDEYLLQHTNIDYQQVRTHLFDESLSSKEREDYIEHNLEHPLIRYRARFDIEAVAADNNSEIAVFTHDESTLIGAKVLLAVHSQYHKSQDVILTNQYFSQNKKRALKPFEQVANYLNLIEEKQNLVKDKQQLYSGLIVSPQNISDSYFESQSRISEQQGRGKIDISPAYKQQLTSILIKDQQASLDLWLEYLEEEYPTWYKIYVLDALKNMGAYDKDKNKFSKRRKDYVGIFPELNREALSQVYDHLYEFHNKTLNIENLDRELVDLLKTGSFVRLYEYFLVNTKGIVEWSKDETEGKWVVFEQSVKFKEKGEQLAKSLQGYNTGWCTAGVSTAQSQVRDGDFYVYYSKNKLGFNSAPRIAIRMEDWQVAEVRGIEPNQNLESSMTSILKEKIKNLPGGKEYFIKTEHMERLTHISNRIHKRGKKVKLSKADIRFLYEIDETIQGFGYQKDPRLNQIIEGRDMKKDLSVGLELSAEEIFVPSHVNHDVDICPEFEREESENSSNTIFEKDLEKIKWIVGSKVYVLDGISEIADNFTTSNLIIDSDDLRQLPQGLTVNTLDLTHREYIRSLPEDIVIRDNLEAAYSGLQALPEHLKIKTLDVRHTKKLIEIPGLETEDLKVYSSCVKIIHPGFKAKNIYAQNSRLEKLPDNLNLTTLNVSDTPMKALPENLIVDNLIINSSSIRCLPEDIKVKDIHMNNTIHMTHLPDTLQANLIIANNSGIQKLPKGLKVKTLQITGTDIETLPEDLQVDELLIDEKQDKKFKNKIPKGVNKLIVDSYVADAWHFEEGIDRRYRYSN